MSKQRFIDGVESYGRVIDWNRVNKRYRRLRPPAGYWDPTEPPWGQIAYDVELSTRSTGKTTNAVLYGMCIRAEYPGSQIGLIRCREEQIMPKNISQMLDTIRTYDDGRYIKELTDGRWNDIQHDRTLRAFRYVNRDETGDIFEKDEPFMYLLCLNNAEEYKSSLVAPLMDWLIFDEFISEIYDPLSFRRLMDIIRTIFRDRLSGKVLLLANTIRPASPWYRELEIGKALRSLDITKNEAKLFTTDDGTPIWLHVFDTPSEHRRKISSWFFGFRSPELAAIRGDGQLWVYKPIQRIVNAESDQIISRALKIDAGLDLLGVDIVLTEDRGLVANIHPVTSVKDTDIILTNGQIWDQQHRKGRGFGPLPGLLEILEEKGKLYFSDPETATSYDAFMEEAG